MKIGTPFLIKGAPKMKYLEQYLVPNRNSFSECFPDFVDVFQGIATGRR
jgi:hypothetical protein